MTRKVLALFLLAAITASAAAPVAAQVTEGTGSNSSGASPYAGTTVTEGDAHHTVPASREVAEKNARDAALLPTPTATAASQGARHSSSSSSSSASKGAHKQHHAK